MVKICMGFMGGSVANSNIVSDLSTARSILDFLTSRRVEEIDTARVYGSGTSERVLGDLDACSRFRVSTKAPAFSPGSLQGDKIKENCRASLEALKVEKVDIYYLHGPDAATPFDQQCAAIDELYKAGKFDRFGVSNLTPKQVRQVHAICREKGWVLPSVYQGAYNPATRSIERTLFPVLRDLRMAFYAYSPLAGGFLAKPLDQMYVPPLHFHLPLPLPLPLLLDHPLTQKETRTRTCIRAQGRRRKDDMSALENEERMI